jgi:hypothetical protein
MLTSLSLSIISTRNGKGGPAIFDKTLNTGQQQKSGTPAPGGVQVQTIPTPAAVPAQSAPAQSAPTPTPAPAQKK